MAIAKQKIIQAFIQGLNEACDKLDEADALFEDYKSKFQALNPNLADTNITANQITAVNKFIKDVNNLANSSIANAIRSKSHPSHGTKALD